MIWVKDWNEDREDPDDVDIFNIIQTVQDPGIHLEVDEKQWKITQGSKRQAKWVWSPRTMSGLVYLTLTDPLRIQPWSQDRRNQTKSNQKYVRR